MHPPLADHNLAVVPSSEKELVGVASAVSGGDADLLEGQLLFWHETSVDQNSWIRPARSQNESESIWGRCWVQTRITQNALSGLHESSHESLHTRQERAG
ncbi:hypothetical protein HZA85_03210 [Candidatus Uhrbacteria bacterium]|nr:hypothetical protein [Candidatus Uhrbacteria bacterium]